MVLIDNYDALVNRGVHISEEFIDFSSGVGQSLELFQHIKAFLNKALLHLAFFTGLTPIALQVFGYSFNNVTDHTRLPTFTHVCGVLGHEIDSGLRVALARHAGAAELDAHVEKERHIMRMAYQGYRFTTSPAPPAPGIDPVFNNTCVAHYMTTLSLRGSVPPEDLDPPAISLSGSATDAIRAVRSHLGLLADLLAGNSAIALRWFYADRLVVPRDGWAAQELAIALLYYHGAATLTEEPESLRLVCPNQVIARALLREISGATSDRKAASEFAARGDAAALTDAVFET